MKDRDKMHSTIFEPFLTRKRAVILDGGFATQLERLGKDLSQDHLWSARILADDPPAVQAVHEAYFEAGADVATTASYQASFDGFQKAGYGRPEAEALLRRSVRLADAARCAFWARHVHDSGSAADERSDMLPWQRARGRPLVAFSAGPYATALADGSEYDGSYADRVTEEQLLDFHRQRLQAVADEPAIDILAFETVPCLKELRAIARLLSTEGFGKPAWVSCSCASATTIPHGESLVGECFPVMCEPAAVVAVGVNCLHPSLVAPILQGFRQAQQHSNTQKLLLAYPNSGEQWDASARDWKGSPGEASEVASDAQLWVQSGASLVGGCCRTTPGHIRVMADALALPDASVHE